MRKFILPALMSGALACAGCATPGPLSKAGATPQVAERDRQQCEGQMYADRQSRGRSAPNWNLYEYCMKQRGYTRAH